MPFLRPNSYHTKRFVGGGLKGDGTEALFVVCVERGGCFDWASVCFWTDCGPTEGLDGGAARIVSWWRPQVMEQKHILLSALIVGVGVSVGLGLASGQTVCQWTGLKLWPDAITEEQIEHELRRQVMDGRESKITFDKFPYFLSLTFLSTPETLRLQAELFCSQDLLNCTANTRQSSSSFLPSKVAAMQSKYGSPKRESSSKKSISEVTLGPMSGFLGSFSILPQSEEEETKARVRTSNAGTLSRQSSGAHIKSRCMNPPKHGMNASTPSNTENTVASQCATTSSDVILTAAHFFCSHFKRTSNWAFDEKHLLQSLYRVLDSVSETCPIILYLRDVEKLLLQSERLYKLFQKMLGRLSGSVLILGSRMLDPDDEDEEMDERVSLLFPYNIEIKEPEDETCLDIWEAQLEKEREMIQFQENKNHIAEVLAANDIGCNNLGSICHADSMILSDHIEEIVISALSYHLMHNKNPEYRNGKLVISSKSLSHGLSIFKEDTRKTNAESSKLVPPYNEFERRIRPEVIPANQIGVAFEDIGALDDIKESLQELVMLPLQRPDLFKGGLLKPCRGILLFGPPGNGKTMLAKAIANEAGARFINVSMSTVTSKWFGEVEKNVRALFTLAAKISPTIIFVDEADSLLGQRTEVGEHYAMRQIKNEFMTHWDGLLTKAGERVLVLAATNRPFDLDEAIIRRFEHRIMVGLPSVESREMILKTLLAKEKAEDLDFKELATMTEGYTGSDLKNLCMTAAYRPVKELLQQERLKEDKKKKQKDDEGKSSEDASDTKEEAKGEKVIVLRPLNMEDMRQAKNQVAASFASDEAVMNKLKQWNELYGDGGSRKKKQLTYFL
ncbi:ATPase family AAA domain-containing protein 1-A [Vitis vinifera]|uniref:ATPase family AAA domain-containing protein 1-A n=1 Tax=Vitis vinifera TaxID=29760 RepID=A0A438ICW9_VITVI|nr:ATPase family AAA domain-containing protein 1-A [Vitis vinifera]